MNLFLQEEEVDSNMEKTANQWKKLGFILKDGAVGVERTQQFGSRYTYYTENEVRPLTEVEKLQIKEKAREERRLHRILLRAYKDYERYPEDLKVDLPLYFDEQFYKNRYLPFKEKQKEVKELIEEALQKEAVPCSNPSHMIVIDIETTGYEYRDDVLQVSVIDGDGRILLNSYVKPYYQSYWQPEVGISYIFPEKVADAPELHELIPQMKGILDSCDTVIGYNTGFVISFLNFLDYSGKKEENVMEDFAPIYGEWLPSFEAHKWQTLGTCADYYGFDWNSMEDYVSGSLRDCYAILHCYRCMKKQMKTMMNMHKWEK